MLGSAPVSNYGRGNTLAYAPTECFETFPFPQPDHRTVLPELEAIGEKLYATRARFMIDTDQGLTKTYNALKNPDNDDPRILELRSLHEEMDRAVLAAYGWSDIPVPPYCPLTDEDKAALQTFEDEVIVDEPRFDVPSTPGTELFGARAMEITETLLRPGTARAGAVHPPHVAPDAGLRLPCPAIRTTEEWQWERALRTAVPRWSRRWGGAAGGVDGRIPARSLDLAPGVSSTVEMRRVLARLAALRVPSPRCSKAPASPRSPRSTRHCHELLFTADDGALVLPAALSQAFARDRQGDPRGRWRAAGDSPLGRAAPSRALRGGARRRDVAAAVREEMEEIHHLTAAGDAESLLTRSLQFVEQYDALGKSLVRRRCAIGHEGRSRSRSRLRAGPRARRDDA